MHPAYFRGVGEILASTRETMHALHRLPTDALYWEAPGNPPIRAMTSQGKVVIYHRSSGRLGLHMPPSASLDTRISNEDRTLFSLPDQNYMIVHGGISVQELGDLLQGEQYAPGP